MKPYFDVVIIAPLNEEFERALKYFKFEEDLSTDAQLQFRVSTLNSNSRILLVKQEVMGRTASQAALISVCEQFDIGLVACLGIAGALSPDLNIGDVCYSKEVIDVLDNAKITQNKNGSLEISFWPTYYSSPIEITTAINRNRFNPNFKNVLEEWRSQALERGAKLIPGEFVGKKKSLERIVAPAVVEGLICCGDVCASEAYRDKLRDAHRKVLAIETESGGMFSAAKIKSLPAITVRGISDYADIDKNTFEDQTGGMARTVAIDNAASFLSVTIASELMQAWLNTVKLKYESGGKQLSLLLPQIKDPVGEAIKRQHDCFEEKLRELAPTYSLQAKGYHLPIPRVRPLDNKSGSAEHPLGDPIDIEEAARLSRVLVLAVPKDYPDNSLSWIIGQELLTATINEKQVVPCVLEAKQLKRPSSGLGEVADQSILTLLGHSAAQPTFIIDNFSFDSKTRTDFLLEQVQKYPDAHFIVVTRNRMNVITENQFISSSAASVAHIDEVSFIEIAHFLQKKFELTAPASEVVATRLQDTFNKFDLSAHPSYFSGIPQDTLGALLEANRRGELIQLAVAGYLSFVVANDQSAIVLSRTTREKFLSELAFAIHVEGKSLSEEDLQRYAEDMGARFDYGVSAKEFLSIFVEKGILYFDDGCVAFTLPFMEAYLLAKRLHDDPDTAEKYFDLDSQDFDMPTFALYAELGASSGFVQKIMSRLTESIDELKEQTNDLHILLGDRVRPVMLNKPQRLDAIQKRVAKAVADVREDRDQSREKQRLLDATDRMRERASSKSEAAQGKTDVEREEKSAKFSRAITAWGVSVNLLGSGSERIEAGIKRQLIKNIVEITSLIIDQWTRVHQLVDFAALKAEIKSDTEMMALLQKSDSPDARAEAERLADSLIDLFEYIFLAEPFRRIVDTLCEEARDKVLSASFDVGNTDVEPHRLIESIWLADIDAKKGRDALLKSIKDLPHSQFLRVTVATHLMTRVTWNHWKKDDRLILLDATNELLKPFGQMQKYAEVRRLIVGQ